MKNTSLYTHPVSILRKTLLLFVILTGLFSNPLFAQTTPQENTATKKTETPNAAMLSHYPAAVLVDMQTSDSLKYQTLLYYYRHSFIVEAIDCSDCVPKDMNLFDVSEYEKFRLKSERYVRVYEKYGFRLTLLSVDELLYKLPVHLVKEY